MNVQNSFLQITMLNIVLAYSVILFVRFLFIYTGSPFLNGCFAAIEYIYSFKMCSIISNDGKYKQYLWYLLSSC